ncbi:hypothetical protein [Peptacetobacter sp. AB845]|uniref:hypothetical protein n=1 Tax=Peptacetobacter sp. AB845 TaxID=3388429 RepID=UPI0039C9A5A8
MEFYIQINPCNPKELKEYLDIVEEKGLLDFTDVEVAEEQQPKEEEVIINNWTTNEDESLRVVTREELRDMLMKKSKEGVDVRGLLKKYKANSLGELEEGYYAAVMEELENGIQS